MLFTAWRSEEAYGLCWKIRTFENQKLAIPKSLHRVFPIKIRKKTQQTKEQKLPPSHVGDSSSPLSHATSYAQKRALVRKGIAPLGFIHTFSYSSPFAQKSFTQNNKSTNAPH